MRVEMVSLDEGFLDLSDMRTSERIELARGRAHQPRSTRAARLGEKLRQGGLATNHVTDFDHTSEHDRGDPMWSVATTVTLPEATSGTLALIKAAVLAVEKTWWEPSERPWRYSKAGVITTELMRLEDSLLGFIKLVDAKLIRSRRR